MSEKRCVLGRFPDDRAEIPHFETPYFNGESILQLAEALIAEHQELSWMREGQGHDYKLVCFWKKSGGTKQGKPVLGTAGKVTGLMHHLLGDATFQIVMAADHCKELSNWQLEAAVYHQICVPGDTEVTAGGIQAASRRWYSGELIEIATAEGYRLSGTPNHPVLTATGWQRLDLLNEGDYVVSCRDPQRVMLRVHPDVDHVPTRIEQIAESGLVPLVLVPEATEHLDANSADGEVDVVDVDRLLLYRIEPTILQPVAEFVLDKRDAGLVALAGERGLDLGLVSVGLPAPGSLRLEPGRIIERDLVGSFKAESLGVALSSGRYAGLTQPNEDDGRAGIELLAESFGGEASGVSLDQIVKVNRNPFDGHVFNLQTESNWYVANNIIAHNCHLHEDETETAEGEARYEPTIRGHEFEGFIHELDRYGMWSADLDHASVSFAKQLKLDLRPAAQHDDVADDDILDVAMPGGEEHVGDWTEGDEAERRAERERQAAALTAKGDGVRVVYDPAIDGFRTSEGDIYADRAVEEAVAR